MADFKKGGFGGGGQGFKKSFGRPSFEGRQSFKHGGGSHGGANRGDSRGERRGDSQKPQMFDAVCSQCGKKCEVPFKPSGDRPVLCSDCFNLRKDFPKKDGPQRETAVYRKDAPQSFWSQPDSLIEDLKRQVENLHAKLDKVLALMQSSSLSQVVKHAVEETMPVSKPKKKAVKKKGK
jgi:CxxC-x17-CxxC domain-containing protein